MGDVQQYLLTVTAAAMVCAVVNTLSGPKGTVKAVLKLLTGLFLALSVISPWLDIGQLNLSSFTDDLQNEAVDAVSLGETMALDSVGRIIKEKTAAYILDKAESLGLDIVVEVTLDSSNPPQPCAVKIDGATSPYAKDILMQYIEDNLKIAKENQSWE